ncbi:hypothetical protein IFM89_015863, partial [Coptis chinensis]
LTTVTHASFKTTIPSFFTSTPKKKKTKNIPMATPIRAEDYTHSPIHYAIIRNDQKTLTRLISTLPKLTDPSQIHTESDSLSQERLADQIASLLDRRDVPHRETPLHLAVRLNDNFSAKSLAAAGADVSLQNAAGWNPLQEAVCRRSSEISLTLLRYHHKSAWAKWRRRLPRLVAVLSRMRDFYMEISFHFESSLVPFVGKIAPSDTYKIWKRGSDLRADTSLAGFDGLKIQRSNQSFVFLGEGDANFNLPSGALLVLNRDERKIFNAFENAEAPMTDSEISEFWSQTTVYRPGMDVTKAELVGRMNWRRQERMENVGEWKAKVYEIHNVVFSFRSRKVSSNNANHDDDEFIPLELEEDEEDGFLVAENPRFSTSSFETRRHSSFVREERDFVLSNGRKSLDVKQPLPLMAADKRRVAALPLEKKEKEYVKNLRPSVWLTEQFPLKTEDLLPLLDILANKVKAVRRLRELLTTKFPPGTFPVKVTIPVVPTVKVVITFTKFVELQPLEQFYTPLSSPRHLLQGDGAEDQDQQQSHKQAQAKANRSTTSWLDRSNSHLGAKQNHLCTRESDPFSIPSDYTWTSIEDKTMKMKKSRSTRRGK